jgi:hypothetical protein
MCRLTNNDPNDPTGLTTDLTDSEASVGDRLESACDVLSARRALAPAGLGFHLRAFHGRRPRIAFLNSTSVRALGHGNERAAFLRDLSSRDVIG